MASRKKSVALPDGYMHMLVYSHGGKGKHGVQKRCANVPDIHTQMLRFGRLRGSLFVFLALWHLV